MGGVWLRFDSDRSVSLHVRQANADPVKYVPDVVTHLMRHQPPGAILVFLPGWNEISRVRTALCKQLQPQDGDWVLPLHSRLPFKEQQRIFDTPPPGESLWHVFACRVYGNLQVGWTTSKGGLLISQARLQPRGIFMSRGQLHGYEEVPSVFA